MTAPRLVFETGRRLSYAGAPEGVDAIALAAAAAELDKDQVAENAITKFLELKPNATVTSVMDLFPATGTSFAGRYRAGFIKAGFSE